MLCDQGVGCLICMAPGRDMGPVPISEHEKCCESLTIHPVSRRPIGSGISPVGPRPRPPFPPARPSPPCGWWVRRFAKVLPRIASTRRCGRGALRTNGRCGRHSASAARGRRGERSRHCILPEGHERRSRPRIQPDGQAQISASSLERMPPSAAGEANKEISPKLSQVASISVPRVAGHPRRLPPEANR